MAWADEYPCIAMDPPWWETGGGRIKRGADKHYSLIKTKEMPRVILQAPCWRPADDAHLWMWVTNRFLPDGLWLMDALGFRYVTNRAWAKMEVVDCPDDCDGDCTYCKMPRRDVKPAWQPQKAGLGQYLRGQHELLLFGVRGKLPARWKSEWEGVGKPLEAPGTLLLAPRGEHSQKPDQAYIDIAAVSPGPRLEMFARGDKLRIGWDMWGDEVTAGGCGGEPT